MAAPPVTTFRGCWCFHASGSGEHPIFCDTYQLGLEQLKMEPLPRPGGTLTIQEPTETSPTVAGIPGGIIYGIHLNRGTDIGCL